MADDDAAGGSPKESASGALARGHVVLMSADPELCSALERTLLASGYGIRSAHSGVQGLEVVEAATPLAVLADDLLPDIEGASVIRRLKTIPELMTTPCVLLTESLARASEREVLESGSDAYLLRSERPERVVARLRALLGGAIGDSRELSQSPDKPRLLAVDDSPSALERIRLAFEVDAYELRFASSGEEALRLLERERVDCVLLDLMMPGLSGRDVCHRIKSSPLLHDIPVLMLTVKEDQQTMLELMDVGADDYITKSSSFEIVRARVRSQLRRRGLEEQARRIREALHHKELEAAQERVGRELAESRTAALRELDHLKDEFLSIVSHDLRAPLSVLLGALGNLLGGVSGSLSSDQVAFVEMAHRNAQRLDRLIADLLDLSRIREGALVLTPSRMDLGKRVSAVLSDMQALAEQHGVTLVSQVDDVPVVVDADGDRVDQIVINLLSNACRFAAAHVWFRVRARDGSAEIVVEDDGPGIPTEALECLFERFSPIRPRSSKSGTGLGLSIVRAIAEAHAGTVDAQNRIDDTKVCGARFVVRLPLAEPAEDGRYPAADL